MYPNGEYSEVMKKVEEKYGFGEQNSDLAKYFSKNFIDKRRLESTRIGPYFISTISTVPMLFMSPYITIAGGWISETMIFKGDDLDEVIDSTRVLLSPPGMLKILEAESIKQVDRFFEPHKKIALENHKEFVEKYKNKLQN